MTVLLIHGGLGEDIGADRFWVRPGVVAGRSALGFDALAPDRTATPVSWPGSATDLAPLLAGPSTVVAGSNGVSVALRLAAPGFRRSPKGLPRRDSPPPRTLILR